MKMSQVLAQERFPVRRKRGEERGLLLVTEKGTTCHCSMKGEKGLTKDHVILIPILEAENIGGLILFPGTETETIESLIPNPV